MLDSRTPPWIHSFLRASYFTPCSTHVAAHKSERNFFCVHCDGQSLCQLCVQKGHVGPGHDVVQIRRSSYHDAVRVNEISRLLDLSSVQVYVINAAKIVFLNGRPQARFIKGASYYCETCNRTLLDSVRFCSIGCKLAALRHDPSISLVPRHKAISWGSAARGSRQEEGAELSADSSHTSGYLAPSPEGLKRMRVEMQRSLMSEVSEESGEGGVTGTWEPAVEGKARKSYSLPHLEQVADFSPGLSAKPQSSDGDGRPFGRARKRKGIPHRSPLF